MQVCDHHADLLAQLRRTACTHREMDHTSGGRDNRKGQFRRYVEWDDAFGQAVQRNLNEHRWQGSIPLERCPCQLGLRIAPPPCWCCQQTWGRGVSGVLRKPHVVTWAALPASRFKFGLTWPDRRLENSSGGVRFGPVSAMMPRAALCVDVLAHAPLGLCTMPPI